MRKLMRSTLGLILVAVAFLLLNALAAPLLKNRQLDLTRGQLYSLSEGTRNLLTELAEPVELELFFSARAARELPRVRQHARRIRELLELYVRHAGGNLKLKLVEPLPFSAEEERAAALGLQPVPMPLGEMLYLGLSGRNSSGRQAAIPLFALDQEHFLEYELSRLLQDLSRISQPVVGLLSGLPLEGGFANGRMQQPWAMLEQVRQQFALEFLDVGTDLIPPQVDVLWLVHPRQLSQPTLYAIDQFVMRGGRLLVFVDPLSEVDASVDLQLALGQGRNSDLDSLFKAWGLKLLPERVVGDATYAMTVAAGEQQRPVRHLAWLNVPQEGLNREDVVTARLERLTMASAGILQPLEQATTRFVPLVESSAAAMPMAVSRLTLLEHPGELLSGMEPTGERYVLAARIQGPAASAFPGGLEGQLPGIKQADDIQVTVVADTDMLSDSLWMQYQEIGGQQVPRPWADNGNLVLNLLENLTGSRELINVRSRGELSRPFTLVERIRRSAEERFRDKEQELQGRLARLEQRIADLQLIPEQGLGSTPEEQQLLQQHRQEQMAVRRELREVRYQQNADIEALGQTVKLFNLLLMPVVLVCGLLLLGWRRYRRQQAHRK